MKRTRWLIGLAAMVAGSGTGFAQGEKELPVGRCSITGYACVGCTADWHIHLRKGTACVVALTSTSRGTGLTVTRKPIMGGAKARDLYKFEYWSTRAGSDSFQVRRDGIDGSGRPFTSILNVNARVTD